MKLLCDAVVTDVVESEKYGQSLGFVDLSTGGIVRISMDGGDRVELSAGMAVRVDIEVKARPDKSFGNYLTYLRGNFKKLGAPATATE